MKTNSILLLASLAVFATSASAASSQPESDIVVLPTYTVEAPRYQPAEQMVNTSLAELRQQARLPALISTELEQIEMQTVECVLVRAELDAKSHRFAKI